MFPQTTKFEKKKKKKKIILLKQLLSLSLINVHEQEIKKDNWTKKRLGYSDNLLCVKPHACTPKEYLATHQNIQFFTIPKN